MADHPIPNDLMCDHLFLLVGSNPLPNWVAAKLLLKKNGLIYLVHSKETEYTARHFLGANLVKQRFRQPIYIALENPSSSDQIYIRIKDAVKKITSGQIGFNYTGGTKAMSVHTYRAIEKELPQGIASPIFSYLDARSLEMQFDHKNQSVPVGLADCVRLSLTDLMKLHGGNQPNVNKEPLAFPVAEAIKDVHRTETGYKNWRKWVTGLKKKDSKPEMLMLKDFPTEFKNVADALANGKPDTLTIKDLCQQKVWGFDSPGDLISWMEGKWLDSYVLGIMKNNINRYGVNDYGGSFKVKIEGNNSSKAISFKIEADVAAMRGYQLRFISCYTSHKTEESKLKLFEGIVRARRIGGDESCVAVVCMSEDPKYIENNVASIWQEDRIRVFGRHELMDLDNHLDKWFNS